MDKFLHKKDNLTWFKGHVCPGKREKHNGHKGAVIWFTGLSASGKSTMAHILEKELHDGHCLAYVLDGDNVRHGLCSDLGFAEEDRIENMRRVGELAKLFVDAGIIVITAFISPYRKERDAIRRMFPHDQFLEIFLKCPLEVCAERDKKGLYARAMSCELPEFTGVSAPYEEPDQPDMRICTDVEGAMPSVRKILRVIESKGIIPGFSFADTHPINQHDPSDAVGCSLGPYGKSTL